MALSGEQRTVLARIKRVGRQVGASRKELKAAVQTGLVESGLRNLPGGDRDSAGWRQERASLYRDPTNLNASIRRFFSETRAVKDKYARAGDLAAAVQRPAAQYRGRYEAVSSQAEKLLGQSSARPTTLDNAPAQPSSPGIDPEESRRTLLHQYLQTRGQPGALIGLAGGLGDLQSQVAAAGSREADQPPRGGVHPTRANTNPLVARASAIDAQKLPYQWGGGHAGKINPRKAVPLDCSGAVSAVLGIDPRVSGEFTKWGKPGAGGNVTIYANKEHVLMKIRDGNRWRFFGTSKTNPGGGAGWIPAAKISSQYLAGFTARHQ